MHHSPTRYVIVPKVLHTVDNFFPQPTDLSTRVDNFFELSTAGLRNPSCPKLFTKLSTEVDNFVSVYSDALQEDCQKVIHSCGITCV